MRKSLLLGQEGIGNFLVAIYGTEECDCWAAQDNETEGACRLFGFCPDAKKRHMVRAGGFYSQQMDGRRTGLEDFLNVIEDEVQELVETLEHAGHCNGIDHLEYLLVARSGEVTAHKPSRPPVNFTLILSFTYFERSRIASRFGLSIVGCGPCGPWCLPPPLDEFPGPPLR